MSVYDWEDVGGDYAEMDYMAMECDAHSGNCKYCPLRDECDEARMKGVEDE